MSSSVYGTLAAIAAPLLMAIGFTVWDVHWKGSAVMLNAVKCTLASILFALTAGIILAASSSREEPAELGKTILMLIVSAVLGIVIGDVLWLSALQLIGARQVVLVDSIKPFVAALLAWPILGEPVKPLGILGMAITMLAVVYVSLEKESASTHSQEDQQPETAQTQPTQHENTTQQQELEREQLNEIGDTRLLENVQVELGGESPKQNEMEGRDLGHEQQEREVSQEDYGERNNEACSPRLRKGYFLSAVNVVFDVLGSIITKQFGTSLNTFEIAGIRFGSAAVFLVLGIFSVRSYRAMQRRPQSTQEAPSGGEWWRLPLMSRSSWLLVLVGILFTTYFCPALQNYAIFQIPIAVFSTLMALTPIWSIPVVFVLKGERSSWRAIFGSIVAVVGVVPLYFSF